MENYLVLNGQKIELTPEQYKEVCHAVSPKKKSSFDRKERNEAYYYIGENGLVYLCKEQNYCIDILRYGNANYCSDKDLVMKRANYEALERVLWRFSEEHGGKGPFTIYYNLQDKRWKVMDITIPSLLFGPTFCCRWTAKLAIEEAEKWLSSNNLEPRDVLF